MSREPPRVPVNTSGPDYRENQSRSGLFFGGAGGGGDQSAARDTFQSKYIQSAICLFLEGGKIKQTLTAFIDLFQLIHRRKGEKFITGLTTNS